MYEILLVFCGAALTASGFLYHKTLITKKAMEIAVKKQEEVILKLQELHTSAISNDATVKLEMSNIRQEITALKMVKRHG